MKTLALYILGSGVIATGIIGLVLPIIPGLLCIGVGLYIISFRSARLRRLFSWFQARHPWVVRERGRVVAKAHALRYRATKVMRRFI